MLQEVCMIVLPFAGYLLHVRRPLVVLSLWPLEFVSIRSIIDRPRTPTESLLRQFVLDLPSLYGINHV
jgi:hypothetical protein